MSEVALDLITDTLGMTTDVAREVAGRVVKDNIVDTIQVIIPCGGGFLEVALAEFLAREILGTATFDLQSSDQANPTRSRGRITEAKEILGAGADAVRRTKMDSDITFAILLDDAVRDGLKAEVHGVERHDDREKYEM